MGRGSYNGGSTIIYPGGWGFSRLDPVPSKKKSGGAKSRSRSAKEAKVQNGNHDWRDEFLSAVIAAEVYNKAAPRLSKRAPASLAHEVNSYDTSFAWARAQIEYSDIFHRLEMRKNERERKKGLRKSVTPTIAAQCRNPTNTSSPSSATRVSEIAEAIAFHERKLAELKAEHALLIKEIWK